MSTVTHHSDLGDSREGAVSFSRKRWSPAVSYALLPTVGIMGLMLILSCVIIVATEGETFMIIPVAHALWFAAFHVPFTGVGPTGFLAHIGVLPLLPTILVVLFWSALGWKLRDHPDTTERDLRLFVLISSGSALAVAGIAWVQLKVMSDLIFLQAPHLLYAILCVVLVSVVSCVVGLGNAVFRLSSRTTAAFPSWGREGFRLTARLLSLLLLAGAIASVLSLGVHWRGVVDVLRYAHSAVGIATFAAASIAYLPNMMVLAAVLFVGAPITVGEMHLSLFASNQAPLPAFPLLAALPQSNHAWWWAAALFIPLVSTIIACSFVRGETFPDRLKATAFGALTTAAVIALGAWYAGGALGAMGELRGEEALAGLIVAAWILGIGFPTVYSRAGRGSESWEAYRRRRAAQRHHGKESASAD